MLKKEQKELAKLYVKYGEKTRAYREAYPEKAAKISRGSLHSYASAAFTADVMAEVERLQKLSEDAERKAAEKEAEDCAKLWSRQKSVKSLLSIMDDCVRTRDKAREADEPIPYTAAQVEKQCIDSLNKMMGYNEPERLENDTNITIEYVGGTATEWGQ